MKGFLEDRMESPVVKDYALSVVKEQEDEEEVSELELMCGLPRGEIIIMSLSLLLLLFISAGIVALEYWEVPENQSATEAFKREASTQRVITPAPDYGVPIIEDNWIDYQYTYVSSPKSRNIDLRRLTS